MKLISLNNVYEQYLKKEITRQELEGAIYNFYLFNQKETCCCHWLVHEYEDFVSWIFPRLQKAIDKYVNDSSFETFINRIFFIASKEFNVKQTTRAVTEYSTWNARIPELYAHEEPPEYEFENSEKIVSKIIRDKKGRKNSKRILALLLKCYSYISDDFADKVAPMIEMEKEELKTMIDSMRKLRQKKDDEIYYLKERMFYQYYRCMALEKRLSFVKENSAVYERMSKQLDFAKKRLKKLRDELSITRKDASNKQVAEVIGISKGTVDSCLYKLKERFELN